MLFFWRCSSGDLVLKEGEKAPDFSLKSGNGTTIRLSDFRGKSNVVLYFYPKDQTPGCTKEACSFRDNFQSFKDVGAEILGVSVDDEKSHEEFQREYNLNFTLLADTDKQVNKRYGGFGTVWSQQTSYVSDR
jgi:peroxiredoxin Q/BCP